MSSEKRCSFVFGKVEYGNKNCLWFSFTKLVMYLVHRVFLSLRYACGCFMGTCILYFLCMGFHEHFICVYFCWGEISHCVFLAFILMFVTSLVGNSYPFWVRWYTFYFDRFHGSRHLLRIDCRFDYQFVRWRRRGCLPNCSSERCSFKMYVLQEGGQW